MKKINLINLILLIGIIALDILYIIFDSVIIKSFASALFVIVGIVNLIYSYKKEKQITKFALIMLIGLFFGMLGDIVLEFQFIVGAALFAIAHIFYFVSYCFIQKFKIKDIIPPLVIIIPSILFITLAPIFNFDGILMKLVCIIYAVIISCMLGKAVSNLIKDKSILNIVIFVGSFLFFFSDLMLLINNFGIRAEIYGILCLATYYPAQFLLAYSILLNKKNN